MNKPFIEINDGEEPNLNAPENSFDDVLCCNLPIDKIDCFSSTRSAENSHPHPNLKEFEGDCSIIEPEVLGSPFSFESIFSNQLTINKEIQHEIIDKRESNPFLLSSPLSSSLKMSVRDRYRKPLPKLSIRKKEEVSAAPDLTRRSKPIRKGKKSTKKKPVRIIGWDEAISGPPQETQYALRNTLKLLVNGWNNEIIKLLKHGPNPLPNVPDHLLVSLKAYANSLKGSISSYGFKNIFKLMDPKINIESVSLKNKGKILASLGELQIEVRELYKQLACHYLKRELVRSVYNSNLETISKQQMIACSQHIHRGLSGQISQPKGHIDLISNPSWMGLDSFQFYDPAALDELLTYI